MSRLHAEGEDMDVLTLLQRLGQGQALEEFCEALARTADEVVETGNPGEVSLKLKLSNRGVGEAMVAIEESITRKPPAKKPRGAFLYSVEGELFRDDPRQPVMEFRTVSVDRETGEVRDVDSHAAMREVGA